MTNQMEKTSDCTQPCVRTRLCGHGWSVWFSVGPLRRQQMPAPAGFERCCEQSRDVRTYDPGIGRSICPVWPTNSSIITIPLCLDSHVGFCSSLQNHKLMGKANPNSVSFAFAHNCRVLFRLFCRTKFHLTSTLTLIT
jgi:hypothetical protein